MRQAVALFSEKDTRDELGLGTIRDAISNALFPGTSVIQTRLRYVLFVPWVYQALERNKRVHASNVEAWARAAEVALIETLGGAVGVIVLVDSHRHGSQAILELLPALTRSCAHRPFSGSCKHVAGALLEERVPERAFEKGAS